MEFKRLKEKIQKELTELIERKNNLENRLENNNVKIRACENFLREIDDI